MTQIKQSSSPNSFTSIHLLPPISFLPNTHKFTLFFTFLVRWFVFSYCRLSTLLIGGQAALLDLKSQNLFSFHLYTNFPHFPLVFNSLLKNLQQSSNIGCQIGRA
ncbi:unnamed protein product [Meloidogyne enterolobii]|uniref:Uncharacterized protein n=2 Tax=Meloidogyne enterolobii TaxID=390850 RepID=A0ACB0XV13_MELEN|nr:unnamed protein product [Meloidogyne enterolobii]